MSKFIDRTGQVFNNIKIVKEIGRGKVLAECLICHNIDEYIKHNIVKGQSTRCKRHKAVEMLKDRTGQVFNNLRIVKELGKGRVMVKCLLCNSIDEHDKYSILNGLSTKCKRHKSVNMIKDRTGQVFNNLKIVKELGNKKVLAECLICHNIDEYIKGSVTSGHSTKCKRHRNRKE